MEFVLGLLILLILVVIMWADAKTVGVKDRKEALRVAAGELGESVAGCLLSLVYLAIGLGILATVIALVVAIWKLALS